MTEAQSRLVEENTGLVGVHLRRYVRNLSMPRRDREWDDLFQEGCLGLMEAARTFRPERGIPFAAFALPRIHHAVSRALQSKFATVVVPPARSGRARAASPSTSLGFDDRDRPGVRSLSDELSRRLIERRRSRPDGQERETVGDRLRYRYDAAVLRAREAVSQGVTTRGDRHTLVRILTEERFMVPNEERRWSLRRIARETRSSHARVADYDKQIARAIRRALEDDPEFRELQSRSRKSPSGADTCMDEEIERSLDEACAAEFVRRLTRTDATRRACMVHAVVKESRGDLAEFVRDRFLGLTSEVRTRLLQETAEPLHAAR